jgi:hypothetical protein
MQGKFFDSWNMQIVGYFEQVIALPARNHDVLGEDSPDNRTWSVA